MSKELILYTTSGCHLCDEAEKLLDEVIPGKSYELEIRKVDIVESSDLMAQYGIRIPVLHLTGEEEELSWPFDDQQLSTYLGLPEVRTAV